MEASLFHLTLTLVWSLGSDVPKVTTRDATDRANESFSVIKKNCSPNLADTIEDKRQAVTGDIVDLGIAKDQIATSEVEKLIKKGLMHSLFAGICTLNELPSCAFGNMNARDVRTRLFYFNSKQQKDSTSCGWRAFLAAFQMDKLIKKNCLLSDQALASYDTTEFPDDLKCIIDGHISSTASNSSSDWLTEASIKGCKDYLEEVYIRSPEKPAPVKYDANAKKDYNVEAEDEHLNDLAHCLGMSDFYIMHYHAVQYFNPIQFVPAKGAISELLERASENLVACADSQQALSSWCENYRGAFQEQENEIRKQCLANREALQRVLKDYEKHEYLSRAGAAAPFSDTAKLDRILVNRKENCEAALLLLKQCFQEPSLLTRKQKMREWFLEHNFGQVQKLLIESIQAKFNREYIQPNKSGTLQFMLHIPLTNSIHHWIVVCVCKQKDKPPVLTIQDSMNLSLDSLPGAKQLISFLHDTFIKPYMVP